MKWTGALGGTLVATIALLFFCDFALRVIVPDAYYLLPPNSQVRYKTSEFDVVVRTNSFGFRGAEDEVRSGQIIAVGDSYTYGWGLDDAASWPHLLEEQIKKAGYNLDVYNFGRPGTDTLFHLGVIEHIVDDYRPSIVILSVLLSGDFQDVHQDSGREKTGIGNSLRDVVAETFVGFSRLYRYMRDQRLKSALGMSVEQNATENWGEVTAGVLADDKLDLGESVRAEALAGNINPGLFRLVDLDPNRALGFWKEARTPEVSMTIDLIRSRIADVQRRVQSYEGRLFVLCLPSPMFVKSAASKTMVGVGFELTDENFETLLPEKVVEQVLPPGSMLIQSLAKVRALDDRELFFELDTHPNARGAMVISDLVWDAIKGTVAGFGEDAPATGK